MARINNNNAKQNCRASVRALFCLSVLLTVAACGDSGSGSSGTGGQQQGGGVGPGNEQPLNTGGTTDQGEAPSDVTSPKPVAQQLTILEEQTLLGTFLLEGEDLGVIYPEQTYSITTVPMHGIVTISGQDREFTYTPEEDFFGTDVFEYAITSGLRALVTINVINVNDPPTIFAEVQGVIEQDIAYSAALVATDPDEDTLEFRANNLPNWLSLDSSTGMLSGVPTGDDVGLYENISFTVVDPDGLTSEVSDVSIEVIRNNDAPTINLIRFPKNLDAGERIAVPLFPDDPEGESVNVAYEPNDYLDVQVSDGIIELIASEVDKVTTTSLTLLATDSRGGVTSSVVPFTIYPINASGRGRTIFGRGASGPGVHLVVLGDGYREEQQAKFREHVESVIEKMQADVGMNTHFAAWNVHMVETPSVDSGIDDNVALDTRDTVFGTGYFCQSVRRLICGDRSAIYGVAIDEYPNFDQILVLVNDSRYGGSGGNIAISSTESIEIALHEMGHSIAGLADEYTDQYIPDSVIPAYVEGRYANVSNSNDPSVVPWRHWLTSNPAMPANEQNNDVGIFEGAYYRDFGYYRSTRNSLMRSYDGLLGHVNSEQWALSVYSRSNPVLEISPVSRVLAAAPGEILEFSVLPMFDESVQSVQWQLDSRDIPDSGTERPSISLSFPPGSFEVGLTVRDISGLIRKPEPHAGVFQWGWTVVVE